MTLDSLLEGEVAGTSVRVFLVFVAVLLVASIVVNAYRVHEVNRIGFEGFLFKCGYQFGGSPLIPSAYNGSIWPSPMPSAGGNPPAS